MERDFVTHWDAENRVAWTYTHYGRGTPIDAETVEVRVLEAYRIARANLTGNIWFSADEDAYFGGNETSDNLQPQIVYDEIFVYNEEDALRAWWNMYGSANDEANLKELGFGRWIVKFGRGMLEES